MCGLGEYILWKIKLQIQTTRKLIGGPKSEKLLKLQSESFFCLRFAFTSFYTGNFQVSPEKNHPHLKCKFLPKIPI